MPFTILVVDDEPDLADLIRQIFSRQIRRNDYLFLFAEDGLAALKLLNENAEIDIVLADINMPGMDGLTLVKHVQETYPLLKSVIISAYSDMNNIRTAMNNGAFDFLTKPINIEDLRLTVQKTLDGVAAQRAAVLIEKKLLTLEEEIDIAARIQQTILPDRFPEHSRFRIAARMLPAREVGGDFYDFFMLDEDRLGIVIGDVSGKGLPAALFMAVSRSFLKAVALKEASPAQCLAIANRLLAEDNTRFMFVTVFYGILRLSTGEFVYCNGGHNLPYWLNDQDMCYPLENPNGIALGVVPGARYLEKIVRLNAGDSLFLFTDGINEARNTNRDLYGLQRLESCLKQNKQFQPEALLEGIYQNVADFSGDEARSDDITALSVRYLG